MVAIPHTEIEMEVSRALESACKDLPRDILRALYEAQGQEQTGSLAHIVLNILINNAEIAREKRLPICQDTGIDVIFVELGRDVSIEGDLEDAINRGIARGTRDGFLRASVCDPITRKNTGDNRPAVIHVDLVDGDALKIKILPKGCGSENMSGLKMLPPSSGRKGIIDYVVDMVRKAGANACPPGFVGVGVGGTMDQAALLSKRALLRPLGKRHSREDISELELDLAEEINSLSVGPLGFGGNTSCLGVAVEVAPCHIASLPVAVNIQCHAARMSEIIWKSGMLLKTESDSADLMTVGRAKGTDLGFTNLPNVIKKLSLPLSDRDLRSLRAGECVLLTGKMLTGRDQTHKRIVELVESGKELPVSLEGQLIYYVGPTPAPPGRVIGAAGPTTSYRMDAYMNKMFDLGVKATLGKGMRSDSVVKAMAEVGAVYMATIGGAGAYLSECIKDARLVAFEDLGPEALYQLEVEDFPAIVINDVAGNDFYRDCK